MSSVAVGILSGLLMGIVFGFALEKSRVFEPGIIVGQMQLRNWIMLKVFLTAVATGAVVLAVLHGFGFVKLQPKAALYAADIVGGLILGAGIALAGACPGTTLAQIGVGYRDAIFTLLGGLCRRGGVLLRPALARQVADRHRAQTDLHRSRRHSLLAGRAGPGRGHRRHPRADASGLRPWRDDLGARRRWRDRCGEAVAAAASSVWRPRNDLDGLLSATRASQQPSTKTGPQGPVRKSVTSRDVT